MIKDEKHVDGIWHTTRYYYKNYTIVIKSRKGSGIKAHAFKDNDETKPPQFTLRWQFAKSFIVLQEMKAKIEENYIPKRKR